MRHSAATNWLAAGASAEGAGHPRPHEPEVSMTDRYTHLIAEHLRDVVDLHGGDGEESADGADEASQA